MNTRIKHLSFIGASVVALMCSTAAQAQAKRYISIDSVCSKAIRLYVSHADGYRNWHVHGPYALGAYEGPTKLRDSGVVLTQTENHEMYIYAESTDGSYVWSGDHGFEYGGLTYNMKKANASLVDGEFRVKLTC